MAASFNDIHNHHHHLWVPFSENITRCGRELLASKSLEFSDTQRADDAWLHSRIVVVKKKNYSSRFLMGQPFLQFACVSLFGHQHCTQRCGNFKVTKLFAGLFILFPLSSVQSEATVERENNAIECDTGCLAPCEYFPVCWRFVDVFWIGKMMAWAFANEIVMRGWSSSAE